MKAQGGKKRRPETRNMRQRQEKKINKVRRGLPGTDDQFVLAGVEGQL